MAGIFPGCLLAAYFLRPPLPRVVNSILSSVLSGSGSVRLSCSVLWCVLHTPGPWWLALRSDVCISFSSIPGKDASATTLIQAYDQPWREKRLTLWQLAFAVLWLTSLCPCVRLYCNSSVSTVLYRTCLAACKLHACFYVIGESLLTAARIPHPLYLWGLGKIYLFCHPLLSPPPQMNSFSLGVDHHDFHVKDGSPYDRPSLMSLTISLLFQNSCCKIIIVNNNNHSKEKVNGYFLLAFL